MDLEEEEVILLEDLVEEEVIQLEDLVVVPLGFEEQLEFPELLDHHCWGCCQVFQFRLELGQRAQWKM